MILVDWNCSIRYPFCMTKDVFSLVYSGGVNSRKYFRLTGQRHRVVPTVENQSTTDVGLISLAILGLTRPSKYTRAYQSFDLSEVLEGNHRSDF